MKDLGTRTLETKRLILRRFTLEDVESMYYGWATDENVSRYVSWAPHKNTAETTAILTGWIEQYEHLSYNWAVERKDTHELIGNISAISVSRTHHNCEIGYCYGSKHWNQGFATEALQAVLDYLLNECEMHIVEAKHYSVNPASGRVMEKAGMIKDAVLKERRYIADTASYTDLVCYYKPRN